MNCYKGGPSAPIVVALMGIPGAGKTTLAKWLAGHCQGLNVVSRDTIRKAMFPNCHFTSAEKEAAFEGLCLALPVLVRNGEAVVIDGTCFSEAGALERVKAIAATEGARFLGIYCDCPVDVAVERVERDRLTGVHPAEDRDGSLVRKVASSFRAIPQEAVKIDCSKAIYVSGRKVMSIICNVDGQELRR